MVALPRGKESESAGLHPLLDIGESHLEAISIGTPRRLRGRERFSRVTPTEFIGVCCLTLIVTAGAVYAFTEKAKSDTDDLARIHAGQTAVALDYEQIANQSATRAALINALTATPTETLMSTATETPTPTSTVTPQTPTETPKPIDTPIPLDPNPQFILEGQLPQYVELSTIETLGEKSKETGYKQIVFSLAFTDLEGVSIKRTNDNFGDRWIIDTKSSVDFLPFFEEAQVISSTQYHKMDMETLKNPVVAITTPDELAELRKKEPKMAPTFSILLPGKNDVMYREISIVPAINTIVKLNVSPGEKVQSTKSIITIDNGRFGFIIEDHYNDGKIKEVADFDNFIKINGKIAIPNKNLASVK